MGTAQSTHTEQLPTTSVEEKDTDPELKKIQLKLSQRREQLEKALTTQQQEECILTHRRLHDTKYFQNLLKLTHQHRLTNPIHALQEIIQKSLDEVFTLQHTGQQHNWICFLIENDVQVFKDYFNLDEMDIPSKLQNHYTSILNEDCKETCINEPLRKRQRTTFQKEEVLEVKDEIWIPLLSYITTEIVYQLTLQKTPTPNWDDIYHQSLQVLDLSRYTFLQQKQTGIKLWQLNYIQNNYLATDENIKLDIISILGSVSFYYRHLPTKRPIHSYHNLVLQSVFKVWDRLLKYQKINTQLDDCDVSALLPQLWYKLYLYVVNQDDDPNMKYKCINDRDVLWWILNGVQVFLYHPHPSNENYSEACRRMNHLQGINFVNESMRSDAMKHGWNQLVKEIYLSSYTNTVDITKISMFSYGKNAMMEFLNEVGDVKQMLRFLYPDVEKVVFYGSFMLGEEISYERCLDIMESESCFRDGVEIVERLLRMRDGDVVEDEEMEDVEMEDLERVEEKVVAFEEEQVEKAESDNESVEIVVIEESEEEQVESDKPETEEEKASDEEEEESRIEIPDDDEEEETIPMKETSDATVEEPSSIAPSFYEESDEPNHDKHHDTHSTTANKSIDSQERQEIRCDDTTAAVATSDGDHDIFSGEEDETHDTQRTHNISRGEKEVTTPLTLQLKEEKAYEADIEMEDKKRERLAVTFASDYITKKDHLGDDEESKEKAYEADIEHDDHRMNASGATNVVLMQQPTQHHQPPSSSSSVSSLHHHTPTSSGRKNHYTIAAAANQIWLAQHSNTAEVKDAPKEDDTSPPKVEATVAETQPQEEEEKPHTIQHEEEKAYEADSEMDEKERQKFLSHHVVQHQQEDQSSFTDISTRARLDEDHDGDITEGPRSQSPKKEVVAHTLMAPPPAVVRLASSPSPFQKDVVPVPDEKPQPPSDDEKLDVSEDEKSNPPNKSSDGEEKLDDASDDEKANQEVSDDEKPNPPGDGDGDHQDSDDDEKTQQQKLKSSNDKPNQDVSDDEKLKVDKSIDGDKSDHQSDDDGGDDAQKNDTQDTEQNKDKQEKLDDDVKLSEDNEKSHQDDSMTHEVAQVEEQVKSPEPSKDEIPEDTKAENEEPKEQAPPEKEPPGTPPKETKSPIPMRSSIRLRRIRESQSIGYSTDENRLPKIKEDSLQISPARSLRSSARRKSAVAKRKQQDVTTSKKKRRKTKG